MLTVAVILLPFIILILFGIPIAFCAGLVSIFYFIFTGQADLITMVVEQTYSGANSFIFMAIPFFMLAGDIMAKGKISKSLVRFVNGFFHRVPGGLSYVTTISSMLFGAISGSGPATAAAIGNVMAPEMEELGYKKSFTAAVIGASGPLGILIPPSITAVVYAAVTQTSVGTIFLACIGPGILYAAGIMVVDYFVCKKNNYGEVSKEAKEQTFIEWMKLMRELLIEALPAFLIPVIILGGIYSGLFTPTESAVVATVYAFLLSVVIQRSISLKEFFLLMKKTSYLAGGLMLIVGTINAFKWVLASENIPEIIASGILSVTTSPVVFLIITNIIFLIAGMFESGSANILLFLPIVYPTAVKLGIDPVFYGTIIVSNLAIGMITPPFSATLFVSAAVCRADYAKIIKEIIPFLLVMLLCLSLVTFYKPIALFFPKLFGMY